MKQYIDKSEVVAEIERIYNEDYKFLPSDLVESVEDFKDDLLIALDTIEVKEVDLEKEIQQHINGCLDIKFPTTDIKMIAKDVEYTARMFFELGLKTKGE